MFTPNLILNHPYHIILLSPQILMIALHHLSVVRWTLLSAYIQKLITPFLSHLLTLITLTFSLLQHSWPLFYLTSSLSTLSSQKLLSLQNFNQSSKYLSLRKTLHVSTIESKIEINLNIRVNISTPKTSDKATR